MGAVARTPLQGEGTQEQAWLHCDWLWQQPTTSATALCSGHDRMVVVAPHPDDEVLACDSVMAYSCVLPESRGERLTGSVGKDVPSM